MTTLNDLNGYLDDEVYVVHVGELRALLSASIADTAGAMPDNLKEIVRLCRLFMDDESGKYNAQSMMLRIFGLAIAAPPAPSVADAAGASDVHIATVYEDNDGTKHVQLDVENFDDLPVGMKLYARYEK